MWATSCCLDAIKSVLIVLNWVEAARSIYIIQIGSWNMSFLLIPTDKISNTYHIYIQTWATLPCIIIIHCTGYVGC